MIAKRYRKYCIICEAWIEAEFIVDDSVWRYSCRHDATEKGQAIVDRNFGRIYDLEM